MRRSLIATKTERSLACSLTKITPVDGARVDLVDAATNDVMGQAFTDSVGAYSIPWKVAKETDVFVRVMAVSKHVVVANKGGRIHSVRVKESFPVFKGDKNADLVARDKEDTAGAFNILDAIRRADEFLEKQAGIDTKKLEKITVSWTPGYNGRPGDITSFSAKGNDKTAFIYGDRSVDSDEFDDFVLIHE